MSETTEEEVCSICIQTMNTHFCTTICNHTFHISCLCKALERSVKCPICRRDIIDKKINSEVLVPRPAVEENLQTNRNLTTSGSINRLSNRITVRTRNYRNRNDIAISSDTTNGSESDSDIQSTNSETHRDIQPTNSETDRDIPSTNTSTQRHLFRVYQTVNIIKRKISFYFSRRV